MGKLRGAVYWCTTEDHDEDWFVVARTARQAARFFEDYEGYDRGDADANRICAVPEGYAVGEPDWADLELLARCGAKILRRDSPRTVEIAGIVYEEGRLDSIIMRVHDDRFESAGQGRPNGTVNPRLN
jgi:hypothetical protein